MYEILLIENGVYYIKYYPFNSEGKGIDIKLNREEFLDWIEDDKVEV